MVLKHLVAGGAGFIGSKIIEHLVLGGEEVVCIDNLISGSKFNLKEWESHENFNFIEHDLIKPVKLEVDKIWHLSCPASPTNYQLDPIKTLNTCFNATLNLLELAKINNAKLLLTSSSEIYGNAERHPQDEQYFGLVNSFGPRSCYSEGKRISESLCYAYNKKYKLDISVARLFNVFGPKMLPNDGRVISNFIGNALQGKALFINGNGNQTRSFCYIDDIVDGLIKLMNSNCSFPINMGNPDEEYSILEVANLILKLLNLEIGIEFGPEIADEPFKRRPDISKAKKFLNWEPKYSFIYGLQKTIDQFKLYMNI